MFLGCLPLILSLQVLQGMLNSFAALPILFLLSVTAATAFSKSSTLYCLYFFLGTVLSGFFDLEIFFSGLEPYTKHKKETLDIVSYDSFI